MAIEISAGLAIIKNNKLLLVHPTRSSWDATYSIPKGKQEAGEKYIDTAIRETKEEVGIDILPEQITSGPFEVVYRKRNGKTYKRVYYFVVDATDMDLQDVIPREQLALGEVDWAGFLTYQEAQNKIFWRFADILQLIAPTEK